MNSVSNALVDDSRKLLIVKNNPSRVRHLTNLLSQYHYNVRVAETGHQALENLRTDEFDLILLDLSLPDLDGFETLDRMQLRSRSRKPPCILLSDRKDEDTILKGFQRGAQDFISKPYEYKELVDRIRVNLTESHHVNLLRRFNARLERKMEERTAELEKTRAIIEGIAEHVPAVFFRKVSGLKRPFDYLNSFFERLTGYSSEDFTGDHPRYYYEDIIHDDDREDFERQFRAGKRAITHRLIRKDGKTIWVSGNVIKRDHIIGDLAYSEGVIVDLTEKMEAEERIISSVIQTQDLERERVARELHDGVQQSLAGVFISFNMISSQMTDQSPELRMQFQKGLKMLQDAITEIRDISHRMVPKTVEELGLAEMVSQLVQNHNLAGNIRFHFQQNIDEMRLDSNIELDIYRIIQESISNILKYADATKVYIQLYERDGKMSLTIEDNGKGFEMSNLPKTKSGLGLISMASRISAYNGYFKVESAPGRGTIIIANIPLRSK